MREWDGKRGWYVIAEADAGVYVAPLRFNRLPDYTRMRFVRD